jgi:hypothetical protein
VKLIIAAAAIVVALFAAVALATDQAHASDRHRVIDRGPVSCYPVRCHQERTVSWYQHGHPTLQLTQRRVRPAESRTALPLPPWSKWHTIGAVVIPASR